MTLPIEICDRCGCRSEVTHIRGEVLCPKHTTDYALGVEIERLQAELDDAAEGATAAGAIIKARDAKIERLQADLDRKMGRRSDCTICGETVPFVGAVFCSEQCWRTGKDGS